MIVYHPAFDFYNCAFRILLLLNKMDQEVIEVDRMRIWDFYFVFPREAKTISFPMEFKFPELKKVFKVKTKNPYEDLIDAKRIFERMKPFQLSALKYLTAHGFIDAHEFSNNIIKRTSKEIPKELLIKMHSLRIEQENLIKLIKSPFNNLPLYGPLGLKSRTKLIDFKYDID